MRTGHRLMLNAGSGWARVAASAGLSFVMLPYLLSRLGSAGYGVYAIVGSLVGALGLVDLGLAGSVTRFTSRDSAGNDRSQLLATTSTAMVVMSSIGLLGCAIAVAATPFLSMLFSIPTSMEGEAKALCTLAGASFALRFCGVTPNAVLIGAKRQDIANALGVMQSLLQAGLTIVLFELIGPRLSYLGIADAASVLLKLGVVLTIARGRVLRGPIFSFAHVTRHALRRMVGYASMNATVVLSDLLVRQGVNLLVGRLFGPQMVAACAAPIRVGGLVSSTAVSMAQPILPFAGQDRVTNNGSNLGGWFLRFSRATSLVAMALAVPLVVLPRPILRFYVGQEHAWAAPIAVLAVLAAATQSISAVGYYVLAGGGAIQSYGVASLLITAGAFLFAWAAHASVGGSLFTVVASVFGVLVARNMVALPLVVCRQLRVPMWRYYCAAYLRPALLLSVPASGLYLLNSRRPPQTLVELLAYCGVSVALSIMLGIAFALPLCDRSLILGSVRAVILGRRAEGRV